MSESFDDFYEDGEDDTFDTYDLGKSSGSGGVGFKTTREIGTPQPSRRDSDYYEEESSGNVEKEKFGIKVNEILMDMLAENDFLSEGDTITNVFYRGEIVLVVTENSLLFSGLDVRNRYSITEGIIKKVFMSGGGHHIIFCLKDQRVFYINTSLKNFEPYLVDELTYIKLSFLFFDGLGPSTSTETERILFGTLDGKIYEMTLSIANRKKPSCSFSRIFLLSNHHVLNYLQVSEEIFDGEIRGIQVIKSRLRKNGIGKKDDQDLFRIVIMITTSQFLFEFIGIRDYRKVFEYYRSNIQSPNPKNTLNFFQRLPGLKEHYIKNQFQQLHYLRGRRIKFKSFAWLCESGIYHGRISLTKAKTGESAIEETELIRTDDNAVTTSRSRKSVPLTVVSIVIAEFHMYVLYENKMVVYLLPPDLCTNVWIEENPDKIATPISEIKILYEHKLKDEKAQGLYLWNDRRHERVIMYTDQSVYETIVDEGTVGSDVWRLYLDKGIRSSKEVYFKLAESLTRTHEERNFVLCSQGDYFFEKDEFLKAADVFALTSHNFERVVVKFNEAGEKDALRQYLLRKLAIIRKHVEKDKKNTFKTQLTCLCTFLTELYLDKLNQLREEKRDYEKFKKEFQKFLQDNKKDLHKETTFRLISSHGKLQELIFFAVQIREYEFVVNHYLVKERFDKALKVLMKYCSKNKKYEDMWYKFTPILIEHLPNELFDTLKQEKLGFLNIKKLLPTFMRYISLHRKEKLIKNPDQSILGYLQWIINKRRNKDPAIHNLLLFLFAQLDDDAYLLEFLSTSQEYDKEYALRICLENKRIQPCIFLYSRLEQYEDAIQLALDIGDVELAKSFAQQSRTTVEKTKKLWLKIAKFVIDHGNVRDSLDLLYIQKGKKRGDFGDNKVMQESEQKNPYLKFENLLPHFPDHALIDDFKGEICKSLKNYNKEIGTLKSEMQSQSDDLNDIREDIKKLKHKYYQIDPDATCDFCNFTILPSLFYIFPCYHIFHYECLIKEVLNFAEIQQFVSKNESSSISRRSRSGYLKEAKDYTKLIKDIKGIWKPNTNPHLLSSAERKKLDDLISNDCPYCGDAMIDSIGVGFLEQASDDEKKSWKVDIQVVDYFSERKKKGLGLFDVEEEQEVEPPISDGESSGFEVSDGEENVEKN